MAKKDTSDRFSKEGSDRLRKDRDHSDGNRSGRRKIVFKGVPVVPGIAMGPVRLKFRRTQVLSDHHITAKEVDRETFFRTRESGGTMISSAYKLCSKLIEEEYPPSEWNIYPFHFSDGDNWSVDDTVSCIEILKDQILPKVNLFCYGQVESPYGSGQFIKDLEEHFDDDPQKGSIITSEIKGKEAIMDSIKEFLGKGK